MTPTITQLRHRRNKRDLLREFFLANLGRPINSLDLHIRFGTSLRARISELNRQEGGSLQIRNHTYPTAGGEVSVYTAYLRSAIPPAPMSEESPARVQVAAAAAGEDPPLRRQQPGLPTPGLFDALPKPERMHRDDG